MNRRIVKVTDAHVHFWDLEKMGYPWLDDVPEIKQSFGIDQYNSALAHTKIENIVFIQCECHPAQYLDEIDYINSVAQQDTRIKAIVAYFPLENQDTKEQLSGLLARYPLIKGIRRLEETPKSLYANPNFLDGMDTLTEYGLTFDICVTAAQLLSAVRLVEEKPNIRYILDHFGKPNIKRGEFQDWQVAIKKIATNPNVYCKLSGLVTEADWNFWNIDEIRPFFDTALTHFGVDRIVFGSDWPVVTLASTYRKWYETAKQLCTDVDAEGIEKIFYHNALNFYNIRPNGR